MRTPQAASAPLWQPRLPAIIALAVLLAASASAQVATDPPGDATHSTLVGDAGEAPGSADLLSLAIVEDGDLAWTVTFAAGPQAVDEVDTTIAFGHGSRVYHVVAGESVGLWISDEAGVAQRYVGELEGAREGAVLTFRLPKDLVRDEAGMPLADGSRLTGIVVTTSARGEVQGPDPEQGFFCCTAWWTMHDRMPDEAGAAYRVAPGGNATGIRLWSDAPLRASNGGGDRFVYVLTAANGGADAAVPVTFSDVPAGWNISAPRGLLDLDAGESRTFPILVETPSGHRHGGTETLVVQLAGVQTRIGIHYLDVPQPAGHHPRLFFHSQALEGGVIEEAGYAAGRLWMNTLDEDPLDDGAPIDSTESSFGGESARWSICLSEGLRLGLDLSDGLGELDVTLAAQRPYGEVSVSGALYHYGAGPAQATCDAAAYRAQRNETLVASIPATDAQPVEGSTRFTAPVVPEAGRIAYQDGAMLVLDITATFTVPDSQAPGPLVIEPGGTIALPLDEYREGGDVAIPSWEDEELVPPPEEPLEESPAGNDSPAGLLALVGLLAAALGRRR